MPDIVDQVFGGVGAQVVLPIRLPTAPIVESDQAARGNPVGKMREVLAVPGISGEGEDRRTGVR